MAQYADACNFFGGREEIVHKLDVLRRHCDEVGRDPNEIEVTASFRDLPSGAGVSEVLRGAQALGEVGVSTLVVGPVGDDPAGWLERTFGPAMESLAGMEAARL